MANEEQATFWTETAGPVWLEREEDLDEVSRPIGRAVMDAAGVKQGERVLDVGCGTGTTAVELADRVGAAGRVVGLDISPLLLGRARERSTDRDNVAFMEADAQTHAFDETFDLVFSRFGVMFFADPVAAFTNLRSASSGGRLAFACWQDIFTNQWMSLPTMAASSVLGAFEAPPEGAPGPFAFADTDHVRTILGDSGYRDVEIQSLPMTMDTDASRIADWAGFMVNMGPLGESYRDADEQTQERTRTSVLESVESFREDGTYRVPGGAWIVTASA